ncbi:hypothetical protein CDAR_540261 [Caerostris darwini]|uniref:Uncharacterized protein n=1 Tax=Caerostris darwini TaxID=1538125 RepID=A0AAV4WV56_9ARAC|nr:hypothetical protein CDAR_540261 [Caerostris darwini]
MVRWLVDFLVDKSQICQSCAKINRVFCRLLPVPPNGKKTANFKRFNIKQGTVKEIQLSETKCCEKDTISKHFTNQSEILKKSEEDLLKKSRFRIDF